MSLIDNFNKKKILFFHLATTTQNMDTCVISNTNVLRITSKLLKVKNKILLKIIFFLLKFFKA